MPFVLQIAVDPSSTRGAQGTGTNKDYEASFDENLENDVVIGRITNLDPGVTSIRFRTSQPGGGNDSGRYKIIGDAVNGWFLVVNTGGTVNFDREKKPSHNVYIEALNGTNVVGEGDYIVRMRDLNEAATDINFTGAATNLQAGSTGAGTQVVVATAVDLDTTGAPFPG